MAGHRITYLEAMDGKCQARCSCKAKSTFGSRADADEWTYRHHELVEQVKAHLGSKTPSLRSQRDWFRLQADDPENTRDDRDLWRQLADEVDRHMASKVPVIQSETLF
jgi:hypothetical protein